MKSGRRKLVRTATDLTMTPIIIIIVTTTITSDRPSGRSVLKKRKKMNGPTQHLHGHARLAPDPTRSIHRVAT